MTAYMYILECADGSYYTGSTIDIHKRLYDHQNGVGCTYTKKRLPIKLAYCEPYDSVKEAYYREKQIQKWSRRKKKALIARNYERLVELSRNYAEFGIVIDIVVLQQNKFSP